MYNLFELSWVTLAGAVFGFLYAFRSASPAIYDIAIIRMTAAWYESVLSDLKRNTCVLDVGVGTATALARHAKLLERKNLRVVGLDHNAAYVRAAQKRVAASARLRDRVSVVAASVYDAAALGALRPDGGFDAAYFSGSLSLMPDPKAALAAAAAVVRPAGRVYVTQTYQRRPGGPLRIVKPLMKYVTTIDFGRLTSMAEAEALFAGSGLKVLAHKPIPGSVDNSWQVAYRTVLEVPGASGD